MCAWGVSAKGGRASRLGGGLVELLLVPAGALLGVELLLREPVHGVDRISLHLVAARRLFCMGRLELGHLRDGRGRCERETRRGAARA